MLLGFSFKEDCPDTRNTRVIDVYRHLSSYGIAVSIYDPYVDSKVAMEQYGVEIDSKLQAAEFDAVMLCVAHELFQSDQSSFFDLLSPKGFIFDLKGVFKRGERVVRL